MTRDTNATGTDQRIAMEAFKDLSTITWRLVLIF